MSFPRRYLRFRLRSLLILVFVISVLLGGFAWRRDRARRQAAAVATIRQLGGGVVYEPHAEDDVGTLIVYEDPRLPEWQLRWFGVDFFYDVVAVSQQGTGSPYYLYLFGDQAISDADRRTEPAEAGAFWRAVARLRRLRSLYVYDDWAQPAHVQAVLGSLVELRVLNIHDAGLKDENLQGLDRLKSLEEVYLENTDVGDETARRLARCNRLRVLDLSNTQLTDEGLRHLSACRELEGLALEGTKITDAGLAHLAGLPRLETLILGGTSVTDSGLSHLGGLTQLESIELDETQVAGAGLGHLRDLMRLRNLNLQGCPIDRVGLGEISQLDRLVRLNLGRTSTPAEAFATMSWPKGLTDLELSTTEIDDAGLQPILALPNVDSVGLLWTGVTREGHDQFCNERPGVLVWNGQTPEKAQSSAESAARDLQ